MDFYRLPREFICSILLVEGKKKLLFIDTVHQNFTMESPTKSHKV